MNGFLAHSRHLTGGLIAALAFSLAAAHAAAADDDPTTRYFAQLRQRRLFSLAEGYCLSRLAEDELPLNRRTQLTIELSRTLSEHAGYTSGREQAELWQRSTAAIDDLLKQHPANPRRLLLETQRALSFAAQGEHLRWQLELFPYDKTLKPRAAAAIDKAVAQLKSTAEDAAKASKQRAPRRSDDENELSPYELRSLGYHLSYLIGRTLVERAKLDAVGSPDRIGILLEAETYLDSLSKRSTEQELTLESRLLLAESSRLRGDRKQAAAVISSMKAENPSPEFVDRMTGVEARLLMDVDRPTDAAQLLSDYRVKRIRMPGELHYLQIEALSSLWAIAVEHDQAELAARLMEQIEAHAARAASEVGGFWAYRCRLLVETTKETKRYGLELAAVVREAKSQYGAGRIEEAVETYGKAFSTAEAAGQENIAMEIGYTRASILLQSQKYLPAAESFQQLAAQFPQSSQAASAHLLAAYALGRAYEAEHTKVRREQYTDALVQHRETFAGDDTAWEATWMLALLEERRLQVTRALKLFAEIPAGHARGKEAQVAVARCYEKILDRVRELNRPVEAWENDAIAKLLEITSAYSDSGQALTIEQTEVCLRFARICLNRALPDYRQAGDLLDRIERSRQAQKRQRESSGESGELSTRWKLLYQAATQLRIVTLAGGGRFSEAETLLTTLSESAPPDVLGILDGLSDLTANAGEKTRRALGELQLSAAQELDRRRAQLKPAEQQRLDRCLAQAYVATGRSTQAIEVYQSLLKQAPRDRRLLKTVAELLTDCGTVQCLQEAKITWRRVEAVEQAGDPEWLNARYHVAWCAFALKDYSECRKLLAVTRLVYPTLGGEELRERFNELQEQLPAEKR